jgi:hypothetical protein
MYFMKLINLLLQVQLGPPPDNGAQRCATNFPGAGNNTVIGENMTLASAGHDHMCKQMC